MANTSCIVVLKDHSRWGVKAGTDLIITPDMHLVWISSESDRTNAIPLVKIARIIT